MTRSDTNETTCLFVEVQPWEVERIKSKCDVCGGLIATEETLADAEVDDPESVGVLSPFIYSDVDAEALDRFPNAQLVATRSTGFDHVDLDACRERGVTVCNVPTYGANTVAEHTFALILSLTRKSHKAYEQTVRGKFDMAGLRGIDLRDRTIGVVGTGSIGTHVVRIALGFQMRVLAFDVQPIEQMADALGFEYVGMDRLLAESDIVTLHAPYNDATHHMIDGEAIEKMKDGAILVNTARGALVETEALIQALRSGKLGGAGLDVLEKEQAIMEESEMLTAAYDEEALQSIVQNTILLRMDNVIITPHIAFNSEEALNKILDTTVANIAAYQKGEPVNVVASPE